MPSREVEKMVDKIHWLGHASFRVDASKTIYFDPWKLSADGHKADLIFISHQHYDHFSKDDLRLVSTKDTTIVTTQDVAGQLQGSGIPSKAVLSLNSGDQIEVEGVKVRAVPSYNINKQFHTQAAKNLGFVVTIDKVSIYHAGDTDNIPEMKDISSDIALLPVSGTYVMTADEAAQAALAMKPKIAIPMHYGDIVGSSDDAKRFQELLKGKIDVRVLNIGG